MNFKTALKEQFIPKLDIIIEKEKAHIEFLKKFKNDKLFSINLDDLIYDSEKLLEHFELRRKEYFEYAQIV